MKLLLAYICQEMFVIGQSLKHVHVIFFFHEFLVVFKLILDIPTIIL